MAVKMLRGKMTATWDALPSGVEGVIRADPEATNSIEADVLLVALPEIVQSEQEIPVRGGAGSFDIGGRWSLTGLRLRVLALRRGYMGAMGHHIAATISFPLRNEPHAQAAVPTLDITFVGRCRRRGAIERDLTADEIVGAELELVPLTYTEAESDVTTKLVDYDFDDHIYVNGWDLDTNKAVA